MRNTCGIHAVSRILSRSVSHLLAHLIDKGQKLGGQGVVVYIPTEDVEANRHEYPSSVVELVLAVDVQHKLPRVLQQLLHPLELNRSREAQALCVVGGTVHGDVDDLLHLSQHRCVLRAYCRLRGRHQLQQRLKHLESK